MSRNRRILLALALIAGAAVVYVIYRRSSSSASLTGPMSTGSPTDQFPQSSDVGGGGAGAGTATPPPDTTASDILSTLAGENQMLLNQLLGSASGLTSLAGQPYGSPLGGPGTGPPPVEQPAPTPSPGPGPAPRGVSTSSSVSPFAGFTAQTVQGGTVYTPSTAEATVINASPNALRTIGSDAAQSVAKAPAPVQPPPGYGGRRTAAQVRRNA